MTCPDADTLAAVAELGEVERAKIVDHAASCETCRTTVLHLLDAVAETAVPPTIGTAETAVGPPATAVPAPPSQIDRYRIDRELGAGAMGVVYAAYDPELARPVAVKVLRAGGSRDRMRREAQALARLTHPNVVAVHDVGDHDGATFVTMALVDGENLRTWLRTERTTDQIVGAIVQAARGVEAAHRAGIVHRDLKPDNIFVARTGEVLVGDFGLAQSGDVGPAGATTGESVESGDLTRTGSIVGTPAYMAPEQLAGEATAASDQFALCVTAWEALHGARPFAGRTIADIMSAVGRGPPDPPRGRAVPSAVHAAIRRGLAADPDARHPSVTALLAALTPRRRRWPIVAVASAIAIVGGGAAIAAIALRDPPVDAAIAACTRQGVPPVWTTQRRERVLAKLAPPAAKPALATELETVVGRYAVAWSALATDACVAAARHQLSEPMYEATTWCLARRAATLERTLEQVELDPPNIVRMVEGLEPIETCRTSPSPQPTTGKQAQLVGTLDLAAVMVYVAPGAVPDLAPLVADAATASDPAAAAEASYLDGVVTFARGRDPEPALRRAIEHAEKARDDRIRTRASALLAAVAARAGRIADATMHRDLAVSAAARSADPATAIAVDHATVAVAFARQDSAGELAALRRIEALQVERFGDPSLGVADARFAIAAFMHRTNHPDTAAMFERALATLAPLVDETPLQALERRATEERMPGRRVVLAEQIVELLRHGDRGRLVVAIKALGYDYELIGDFARSLAAAIEALSLVGDDDTSRVELLESAAAMAFEVADNTDDNALRERRLDEAHAFLDRMPRAARDGEAARSIRGRSLLLQGRYADALPHLTEALAAAERAEPPHPFRISIRAFALARTLWEVGDARDRRRALALADQAAARIPEARAMFEASSDSFGAALDRLERHAARVETWRRTHR